MRMRFIVGKRVGPLWIGTSIRPGGGRSIHTVRQYPGKWSLIFGAVVGLLFFITIMACLF